MKKRAIIYSFSVCVFALMFLMGCKSPQPPDPRIIIHSSAQGVVDVRYVNFGESKNGAMTLDITILNMKSSPQMVKFAIQWFAKGTPHTSPLAERRSISLLANEQITIHEIAPNANQDTFRITITQE